MKKIMLDGMLRWQVLQDTKRRNKKKRFLGYGLLGFMVAGVGYWLGFSAPAIIVGCCLASIFVTVIEWRVI